MPAPLARGIIITVSIIVAASLAAYENPQIRAWIDRTRQKVAMGLHTLGDEIQPRRPRSLRSSTDISMIEEKGDAAEARRQQIRTEIEEKSRLLDRKRRKVSGDATPTSPSFDTLVDDRGNLRGSLDGPTSSPGANTSAVESQEQTGTLRSRHQIPIEADIHQSVDATIPLRQFPAPDQFESRYEQEMRNTWNIPLPGRASFLPSSHASESLIDFTPTTEDFPDPDVSIPSAEALQQHAQQSSYFPTARSRASSHTLSEDQPEFYYAHPSRPMDPIEPRRQQPDIDISVSSASSVAGSTEHVHPSEADMSEDDLLSEPDGIRTPASAWTEVGSAVSADL